MASQHPSAPSRATGLVHVNVRHTSRFTIIGNHLAQHRELSLLAIGLAVYIQSLPGGASVGVKAISSRFPESELRIAAGMRELEAHGYLARTKERLPDGRFVPRTTSYNQPGAEPEPVRATPPPPPPTPAPEPEPEPKKPGPEPERKKPEPLPARHRLAATLLSRLRLENSHLLLSERDIERLAPGLTAWFDRGAHPEIAIRTLCASLPHDLRNPAALLAHRLTSMLPPPLPTSAFPDPAKPPAPARKKRPVCDGCERPFGDNGSGLCRDCRKEAEAARVKAEAETEAA